MKIEYKKIPNGLDDIATYLGLDPTKTLFMHSTSFDENDNKNISRRAINKGRMLYAEILSYVSNNKNGSKAAICYYSDEYLNFYHDISFLNKSNILKVYDGYELTYPYNSVSTILNKKLKQDENLRKKLEGYTIVSSYLSDEDVESAKIINGRTLMKPETQIRFNSKYYFRKLGKNKNYSIAPGLEFIGLKTFNIDSLRKNYPESNIWIKLESQSGGTGNLFFNNFSALKDEFIKDEIRKLAKKIYEEKYIDEEMHYIVEIDINSIPDTKVIENIGVNAVITPNKITIIGGTSQTTKNGKYIGSCVSESTYKYLPVAEKIAAKAFEEIGKEGYHGFMTIDVIVTKENNKVKAYNIDPNARFSAGTMLLKNIHYAEEKNKVKSYGISYANLVYSEEGKTLNKIKNAAEDIIYNSKTGYGLVPALISDLHPIEKNKYYLKSVLIDNDFEKVNEKYEKFKEKIKK